MHREIPIPLRNLPDCHIVGGAVRDFILGHIIQDIDLATSATPEEVTRYLKEAWAIRAIPTGIEHGTVSAIVEGDMYEITTFRRDISTDGRRATVAFAETIEEDLSRRDFTINAIAMRVSDGHIIDPYSGACDITNREIRAVGDARERFEEDYLRIVRAARFAGRYGFNIEDDTAFAMLTMASDVLNNVSIERVVDEFNKAFKDDKPSVFLRHMYALGILQGLIPEFTATSVLLQNPTHHPEGDVLSHVLEVVDQCPTSHRWHGLLHDVGKKDTAAPKEGETYFTFYGHDEVGANLIPRIAADLKLPNDMRDSIEVTTRYHMQPLFIDRNGSTPRSIRRLQSKVGDYLEDLRIVCNADAMGRRIVNQNIFEPDTTVQPVLMGRDLIDAGFIPGPVFSVMLSAAYEHQIEHGVTDKDALLSVATSTT